jgi:antitoxin HigA-1
MSDFLTPVHPGEILKEEFMDPHEISANRLARDIDVPANRITEIIAGRRTITADTAIRLGIYFGIEPEFWLNLQTHYDLRLAQRSMGAVAGRIRVLEIA